jgi:hypothetical protein
MFVEISIKMKRFFLTILLPTIIFSCQRIERQEHRSEIKTQTSSKQEILLDQSNLFRIRDSIKNFAIIPNISVNAKIKILHTLQDSLQKINLNDYKNKYYEIEKINYLTIKYITDLINNHNVPPINLAKKQIKHRSSPDKKIGILYWNENTGSTFESFINILTYRTKTGKHKAYHLEWINQKKEYPPYAGQMKKIIRLGNHDKQELYMILSEGIECSNCIHKAFIGLTLTNDTINLDYPLFDTKKDLIVNVKNDNIIKFDYYPNFRKLVLKTTTDSITENNTLGTDTVTRTWQFDGRIFSEIVED